MGHGLARAAVAAGEFDDFDRYLADTIDRSNDPNELSCLHPGERIGVLPRRCRRSSWRTACLLLMIAASGWGAWSTKQMWWPWVGEGIAAVTAEIERRAITAPASGISTAAVLPSSAPVEPLATAEVQAVPQASSVAPVITTPMPATPADGNQANAGVASGAGETGASQSAPEPLAEPVIEPGNLYQKRALAIGLHPDLSRVLLSSMSGVDYRNAGTAIRKALLQTADDEKFTWPLNAGATLASFQVHFVRGSSPNCRRYIVTVKKNGWTTTARPMEKCGLARPQRSAVIN
jgi:hypothetical protein